eukprot:872602-Amphidinium_carterae.1
MTKCYWQFIQYLVWPLFCQTSHMPVAALVFLIKLGSSSCWSRSRTMSLRRNIASFLYDALLCNPRRNPQCGHGHSPFKDPENT